MGKPIELLPGEKEYSVVVVDAWKSLEDAAYKVAECNKDEVDDVVDSLELTTGEFVLVYDKDGKVVWNSAKV